jgi:hypothetical protein
VAALRAAGAPDPGLLRTALVSPLAEAWSFARMALAAAGRGIGRNKLRSALTMLGIFIGVAALIAMLAVGEGARAALKAQLESLGTDLLIVLPGAARANGVRGGIGSAASLKVSDGAAILEEDSAVADISYVNRQSLALRPREPAETRQLCAEADELPVLVGPFNSIGVSLPRLHLLPLRLQRDSFRHLATLVRLRHLAGSLDVDERHLRETSLEDHVAGASLPRFAEIYPRPAGVRQGPGRRAACNTLREI